MSRAFAAAAALATAFPSAAQLAAQPSPRWGALELSLSGYRPSIDAEFGGRASPYQAAFGGSRNIMFRADLAYALIADHGSLELGFGAGYWEKYGHGFELSGAPSSDPTALKIVPTRISLTYRFDVLANRYRWLPLAPYARLSLDRYWWWVNDGSGSTANASGKPGYGATNGYSLSAGVALDLGAIDPGLAGEMDRDTGINHTYLFVDFTKSYIRDFDSSRSWDLSDDRAVTVSGGLLFAF